jgi:hypothetical protein
MRASCQSVDDGSGGRHDNYGFALSAQPGESQRRPATNTSSRLIVWIGLPAPSCSRCLCPGWSHHTPRSRKPQPDVGTRNLIPVTNPIESTFATVRHRTIRAKGCLSNKAALAMVFKLVEGAQRSWRRLDGQAQLPQLIWGVKFTEGLEVAARATRQPATAAA